MKSKYLLRLSIIVLLVGAGLLTAFLLKKNKADPVAKEVRTPEMIYGPEIDPKNAESLSTRVGDWAMRINPETLALTVENSKTGEVWSTNSENPQEDSVAKGDNINALKNQFILSFYDQRGNLRSMGSYKDSLMMGQTAIYKMDQGIAVHYIVGNLKKDINDIPAKIKNERFTSIVLGRLGEEEQAEMKTYYKYYSDEDMWSLLSKGRNNIDRVIELFEKAGYNSEDLVADNFDFGITAESSIKALFELTIEYRLENNALVVRIPTDQIVYHSNFPLYEITLLENLATAKKNDDGYILVPDGTGSLIRFNDNLYSRDTVNIQIYGFDSAIKQMVDSMTVEKSVLPVFGLKKGERAILGILEEGEANAVVRAYRAGRNNDNFAVYPTFRFINMDYVYLAGSMESSSIPMFQKKLFDGAYTVRYVFLNGDKANYSGMAEAYREHLINNGMRRRMDAQEHSPLYINTVHGVYGYQDVLGISRIGLKAATTFEQDIAILEALRSQGIQNIQMKLTGWFNGGVKHKFPSKIRVDKELGGEKGLKELIGYAKEKGIGLFPDVDFVKIFVGGNGFIPEFHAAKSLDRSEAPIFEISPATYMKRWTANNLKPYEGYILSVGEQEELTGRFMKKYSEFGVVGLSLRTIGSELYSDFDEDDTKDRTTAQRITTEVLSGLKKSAGRIMLSAGHAYTAPYADHILDVPISDSGFALTDEQVPFLQMVYHGSIQMAGNPMNLTADYKKDYLRSVEYGVNLQYELTYQQSSFMKNTEYEKLYASHYGDWLDKIVESYMKADEILKRVQTASITDHRKLAEGVYRTVYSNGVSVYVNYNTEAVEADGHIIQAESFIAY